MSVIDDSQFCDKASVTKQHVYDVAISVKNVFGYVWQTTGRKNTGTWDQTGLCLFLHTIQMFVCFLKYELPFVLKKRTDAK